MNSSEEEEVPDEIVDEQELEGEEDPASGLLGEQSQSQDVEGQGDEEYFPAEVIMLQQGDSVLCVRT